MAKRGAFCGAILRSLLPVPNKRAPSRVLQFADKGISTIKMTKSFRPPFSKGGAVEAAEASSPSAEGEIPLSALLFCELFSCAYIAKRKAANSFVLFNELLFL